MRGPPLQPANYNSSVVVIGGVVGGVRGGEGDHYHCQRSSVNSLPYGAVHFVLATRPALREQPILRGCSLSANYRSKNLYSLDTNRGLFPGQLLSSGNSLSYGAVPFVVADPGVPSPDSHRGESVHGPVAARSFKPKPQASKTTGYTPPVVLEPKASYKTRACAHVGAREVLILNKHRSKHNFSTN